MSTLKILMLCYELPPVGGGGGLAVHGLARALCRMGHEVDLVTMRFRDQPRRERIDGIEIHRAPCIRLREYVCSAPELATYVAGALPFVAKLARERDYDVNHTHFIFPDGLLAHFVRRISRLPYLITSHGSDVPGYNPHRFRVAHEVLRPVWRSVVRGAEGFITPSRSLAALLRSHDPTLEPSVIPYGIDLERFRTAEAGREDILVVTRMLERKGVQHVLRALEGVELPGRLRIAGDGPYLGRLRDLARRLDVKAEFAGWLDNDSPELAKLYRASGIFVLPSEVENFPVALQEAMSAGLAVVTTAGTGCAEVVGDTGVLVPPNDPAAIRGALQMLIADPEHRAELGRRARARAEQCFEWSRIAERHVALYRRHARRS